VRPMVLNGALGAEWTSLGMDDHRIDFRAWMCANFCGFSDVWPASPKAWDGLTNGRTCCRWIPDLRIGTAVGIDMVPENSRTEVLSGSSGEVFLAR